MSPEPDADSVPVAPVHGTDSDVSPCWAITANRDDAEVSLGEKPIPGPDDTDDFTPIGG